MDKERILLTWAGSGIEDFFLSFELEGRWHKRGNFYCHQGLEKICKAYWIGKRSARWERLSNGLALMEINRIAKAMKHDLPRLVKCFQSRGILPGYRPPPPYSEDDLLEGLQATYIEVRYPVPQPFHLTRDRSGKERFRISSSNFKMYHYLVGETALRDYARSMARALLKKIETEFAVKIPLTKFSKKISDEDWERFTTVFFKF